jgi:nucleoside-diphosphate-sugar epimerase
MLQNVRVLVTGATGFIGSHLAERLVAEGAEVILLVKPGASKANVASILDKVHIHEVDLREGEMVRQLVRECRPSKIYHLAAVGVTEPDIDSRLAVQVNVVGTLNLLEALRETDCDCVINTGTCYEYGHNTPPMHEDQMVDPINAYAASKSAAWLFCNMYYRTRGYPIVTVRPFTVYGPRQSERALIPQVILHALRGEDFPMTGGEQGRDWIYVDDVVEGIFRASLAEAAIGQVINLCTGKERTVREVVEKVLELMGNPIQPLIGALPYRRSEVWHLVGDNARARGLLGWEPQVSLEEGLRRTIAGIPRSSKFKAQSSKFKDE